MGAAVVTGVIGLLAIVTNLIGACLGSRNDRALMDQEIELLKKIDPQTDTAKKIREVINARATRWHQKAFKQAVDGKDIRRRDVTALVGLVATSVVVVVVLVALVYQIQAANAAADRASIAVRAAAAAAAASATPTPTPVPAPTPAPTPT